MGKGLAQEKRSNRKLIEWSIIGLLAVLAAVLLVLVIGKIQTSSEANGMDANKETQVVVYEGPKTLRLANEDDLKATAENLRDFSLLKSSDTFVSVNEQELFVYETNVNHTRSWVGSYLPPISRTPITYFDFEGKVVIEVSVPNQDLSEVSISPLSYGIEPIIDRDKKTIRFEIDTPDTYTLMFDGSPARALHIFANPLERDVPDFEDENVIYIGPGEWDIENIMLESGQTLYLSGGAVVHGIVQGNFAHDITVMGRGIIDGSHLETWGGKTAYIPLKFDYCSNITIKDVIVLNANAWVCQAYQSKDGIIDGVKIISPRPNGDGISLQSCQNYTVENCFVRSWDDSLVVKNYSDNSSNISFNNIQIWTDLAQSMEIGYETNKGNKPNSEISGVTFEDILVLNNYHKPVISIHNGDDADIHDIIFRDIVVENARMGSGDGEVMPYLIDLHVGQSSNWSTTAERGTIHDVLIENVTVLGGKRHASRFDGYDAAHMVYDITIRNLIVLGEKVEDAESGQFIIDPLTTANIVIE